jgi:hypothetical protein
MRALIVLGLLMLAFVVLMATAGAWCAAMSTSNIVTGIVCFLGCLSLAAVGIVTDKMQ